MAIFGCDCVLLRERHGGSDIHAINVGHDSSSGMAGSAFWAHAAAAHCNADMTGSTSLTLSRIVGQADRIMKSRHNPRNIDPG
jgi:hypothetical protein